MTKTSFEAVRKEFGRWSTWAIWNKEQSKIDDTSVIEQAFKTNFSLFRPGIIFIGLNVSKDVSARDWLNFHTRNQSDYNLRQLLIDTPYSGAYITDIFKKETEYIGKSFKYLFDKCSNSPQTVKKIFSHFDRELDLLGVKTPQIYFLGEAVEKIFREFAPNRLNPLRITHPANRHNNFNEKNRRYLNL